MDIIDIILASKKSFSGETETLVRQAKAAMAQANEVAAILQDAQDANTAAQAANEAAQEAQTRAEAIADDFDDLKTDLTSAAEAITNEIIEDKIQEALVPVQTNIDTVTENYNKLSSKVQNIQDATSNMVDITIQNANTTNAKVKRAIIKKGATTYLYDIEKNYVASGNSEDGSMTQKAIKEYVNLVKLELENKIAKIPSSGSGTMGSFSIDDAGNIIIIGPDGRPIAGSTSEQDIIAALIKSGDYNVTGTVGLQIDYANKTFTRTQEAASKTAGANFDSFTMYGGRMRCNVADDGTITAFYGDSSYTDDGSNGQVMVYQPKFYYQRTPITTIDLNEGKIVRKESIILSERLQSGFKLHPLFINEEGEEVDYVLLPAYEGSIYDTSANNYDLTSSLTIDFTQDKLSSIANAKPISGESNNFTSILAEHLAQNRGEGWHITNMAAESANQMLEMVEFGSMNGQESLEKGIVSIAGVKGKNNASNTGSTSTLGNSSGTATSTTNVTNGTTQTYNTPGYRAISYRGMENPWGNIWHFIGGVNIYGQGNNEGGIPYICKDFNYDISSIENYENIGFRLPSLHSWITAMGYGNEKYDWVYMPIECSSNGNSALPVGDNLWTSPGLNGINATVVGGSWGADESGGPFYYGCDYEGNKTSASYGANIMFIPKKNNIYTTNYNKWLVKFKG